MAVGKSQLIDEIAKRNSDLSKAQIKAVVDAFIDTTVKSVKGGESVALIGFGTFSLRSRAARTGRNPKTGESMTIEASKSIGFKMSSSLKSVL